MDIFVDRSGTVVVRNCGCGKHGLTSLWDDHDNDWKAKSGKEASARIKAVAAEKQMDGGVAVAIAGPAITSSVALAREALTREVVG